MLRFLWQDGRLDFSAVLKPTERLSSKSKNFVGGSISPEGRVEISIARGTHPNEQELSYLIWRELDNGRNQAYIEDVADLVANSDYSKLGTFQDNIWYHTTSGDLLPQIARRGLQPGRGQNWGGLPVGNAVYLWPNVAHAWTYRDVLSDRVKMTNPLVLRIENLDRMKLAPDHEEFWDWVINNWDEREEGASSELLNELIKNSPLLRRLTLSTDEPFPYGTDGFRLSLRVLAELPLDLKREIAEFFSETYAYPVMYDGPINADQISIAKTRELTEAVIDEMAERFQQQTGQQPNPDDDEAYDEYMEEFDNWLSEQGDWIPADEFAELTYEPYEDLYDDSANAFRFSPLREQHPAPSMQLNLLTGSEKFGADVEDTEPANNFGFMKEPHTELYPCAFRGGKLIPEPVKETLKRHVLDAIEVEYKDADEWIYFTVYGSGISWNWDEDGDFDIQMWVDYTKFQDGDTPVTQDDLLADVRRLVQSVNFPSFAELGLATDDCEGLMLIQYYPKPGTGSKEENLASKPYACYDLEENKWLYFPEPLTPEFYGDAFILLLPKAQDIAVQSEAALDELARNVTDWQFWQGMYSKYKEDAYLKEAEEAKDKAEQFRDNIKTLFEGVFQGRAQAYSPEGKGIRDERDLLQKLLEVWGIFQKLKHNARAALPWEENELPDSPTDAIEDSAEDKDEKSSSYHWSIIAQLHGLPQSAYGPNEDIRNLAQSYMDQTGQEYNPPTDYVRVDPNRAAQIAQAYDDAEHRPEDPAVARSYAAMTNETLNQYHHLVNNGYSFEFYPNGVDPYPQGPRQALEDLNQNKHLYVYPTYLGYGQGDDDGLGDYDHPLLEHSGVYWNGEPVTHNDIFRAVHDVFGHAKEGVGFRADGEENAWRQHSAMYSPEARPAMTSETRGQNSWVNFGPYGEHNRNADQASTVYAPQKATILPDWVTKTSRVKTSDWDDIQEKAQRYLNEGNVQIHSSDPTHVVATVYGDIARKEFGGDTGIYQTEIWKDDPASNAITRWTCTCPWGEVSWGRTRQWKKFEGRPCAHALAVQWASQINAQPDDQMTIPGMEDQTEGIPEASPSVVRQPGLNLQQFGPTPQVPGGPNPGIPQPPPPPQPPPIPPAPSIPPPAPQRPPSHLTQPGEQMSLLDMPGTFSHVAAFRSGDMVRARIPIWGQDDLGNDYIVPKGMEGEVIWSDDEDTIAIFSIEINGPLEPFNVRVETDTDSFYADPKARPFKRRTSVI